MEPKKAENEKMNELIAQPYLIVVFIQKLKHKGKGIDWFEHYISTKINVIII